MLSPRWLLGVLFAWIVCLPAPVSASLLREVDFEHAQDVGYGFEVCVTGPHPALGGGDVSRAKKLYWSPGNIWRARIALPAGGMFVHRFLKRPANASQWAGTTGDQFLTTNLTLTSPDAPPPPWRGKTVFLHAAGENASILYRDLTGGGSWLGAPLRRIGAGRNAGEHLHQGTLAIPEGHEWEFVFNAGSWINAPSPPQNPPQGAAPAVPAPYAASPAPYNFRTLLDVVFVQDGEIFSYRPPVVVSPPRTEMRQIGSTVDGIPGRPVQIRLPRGYDQNAFKRYPVLYFHDGQNVFFPGGAFGTWDADRIADYETSQGRMRECLLVAVPNGNTYGSNRLNEYLPDGDTIPNYAGQSYAGRASDYLRFLLENVTPTLDAHYRTFGPVAAETFVAGSSMGGLASDFIGLTRPDRFGGVGIFSPAYWAAPRFLQNRSLPGGAHRVFLSMGTSESSTGESSSDVYWRGALDSYNAYLSSGRVLEKSLCFEGVAGGRHTEADWARLLPVFYRFLLDPRREAQHLAMEEFPPQLSLNASGLEVDLRTGFRGVLESSPDLRIWNADPLADTGEAWERRVVPVASGTGSRFWRVRHFPH